MAASRHPEPPPRARLYRLGALLVTAAAVTAVLVAILTARSTSQLRPGKPVPGAPQTLALFAGIPQRGPALGSEGAPFTLVEFGDLQCPACAQFATDALPTVVARYVRSGRVRLIFRALDFIGADSRRAAEMAAALSAQDRLWQFVELAYRNQGLENSSYVTDTYLRALASAIPGVDVARALAARESPAVRAQLQAARGLAERLHIAGTPAFLLSRSGAPARRLQPADLPQVVLLTERAGHARRASGVPADEVHAAKDDHQLSAADVAANERGQGIAGEARAGRTLQIAELHERDRSAWIAQRRAVLGDARQQSQRSLRPWHGPPGGQL